MRKAGGEKQRKREPRGETAVSAGRKQRGTRGVVVPATEDDEGERVRVCV